MALLSAGAVALSAMRVLVVVEVALHGHAFGLAQAVALVLFGIRCTTAEPRA